MSLDWIKQRRFPTYEEFCEGFEEFKRNARKCREKSVIKQKTKMNLPNYKLKGAYSKDEFTDIKSLKERVNDFIELVEKDNARRIRIDFTIEWEKG